MLRTWLTMPLLVTLVAGCRETIPEPIATQVPALLRQTPGSPPAHRQIAIETREAVVPRVTLERPAVAAPAPVIVIEHDEAPAAIEHAPPRPVTRYKMAREAIAQRPGRPRRSVHQESSGAFSHAALGVGAAGLGAAAVTLALTAEDPTPETWALSGTMLGIGLTAMAIGGIIAVMDDDGVERAAITVAPGAIGIRGSF